MRKGTSDSRPERSIKTAVEPATRDRKKRKRSNALCNAPQSGSVVAGERIGIGRRLVTKVGLGEDDRRRHRHFVFASRGAERGEIADQLGGEEFLSLAVGDDLNEVGQDDQSRTAADQGANSRVRAGRFEFSHDRLAGDVGGDDVESRAFPACFDLAVDPLPAIGFGRRFLGKALAFSASMTLRCNDIENGP